MSKDTLNIKGLGSVQKSPSSKAAANFRPGAYRHYVSTGNWRERRWWLFQQTQVWKTDFVGTASFRGVGWAICFQNPKNGRLSNHWISLHESGNVAGFIPILVLDVWEHATSSTTRLLIGRSTSRPFFANIDWKAVDERLMNAP